LRYTIAADGVPERESHTFEVSSYVPGSRHTTLPGTTVYVAWSNVVGEPALVPAEEALPLGEAYIVHAGSELGDGGGGGGGVGAVTVHESLALAELEPLETLTVNECLLAERLEYEAGEAHGL
jgi:hypothetical protein